jgi:hypothetical protein
MKKAKISLRAERTRRVQERETTDAQPLADFIARQRAAKNCQPLLPLERRPEPPPKPTRQTQFSSGKGSRHNGEFWPDAIRDELRAAYPEIFGPDGSHPLPTRAEAIAVSTIPKYLKKRR